MMAGYYRDDTADKAIKEVNTVRCDCFGYKKEHWFDSTYEECTVLRNLYCRNGKCKFYKTREEFKEGWDEKNDKYEY